ncbi:MAG: hypothetical protein HQL71_08545 [Magnetococcales bacterium]|nr:hypothetical protein [Magnetococcales bacterium]
MLQESQLPDPLLLTCSLQQEQIRSAADNILAKGLDIHQLSKEELVWAEQKSLHPFSAHLAIKLARSRQVLLNLSSNLHISVVFAIYKEHQRILRQDEHPHGEDFLSQKVKQMSWLCKGLNNISWDMTLVDDGCPNGSGLLAKDILLKNSLQKHVKVLFLKEAIDNKHPITKPMVNTDDSRKGGAVALGMWESLNTEYKQNNSHTNHVIIYTDADLSTDLGQCGLLVSGITDHGMDAAIGSRREASSIVIKGGERNDRGKLFIYIWKRLLPSLANIIDSQCGFKAFKADVAKKILSNLTEKRFAFDIELLLKTELNRSKSTTNIPIAWFDSEAASTTTDLQPYLPMLKSIAGFYRTYLPKNLEADGFADFIDNLNENNWKKLLQNIPNEITKREPDEFIKYNGVTANELAKISGIT